VAFEVARHLDADLDIIVVRKIGAPGLPEYALGAIAEGGAVYLNPEALRDVGIRDEQVGDLAEREAVELARRVRLYRGDRGLPDLVGRTVLLVDDGVATGATARAAARSARQRGALRVVLAAPVVAARSEVDLRSEFDEVVAVEYPEAFYAVSQWYQRFTQVSDEEVLECLQGARGQRLQQSTDPPSGERTGPDPGEPLRAVEEETLAIPVEGSPFGPGTLEADLVVPANAKGLVMFVHGSGSTRRSPRNRFVAREMQKAGFATLLFDLLMPEEGAENEVTTRFRFDIRLLTERVLAVTRWISRLPRARGLRIGYFGASTGAAAALAAAAALPERIGAVVSRGGRPDLVSPVTLARVRAPVLLVVGSRDQTVLDLNRGVLEHLAAAELAVVPGATHLFEEPGALGAVARRAAAWFERHLAEPAGIGPQAA
jgi:putative phosphoribosyl transferase